MIAPAALFRRPAMLIRRDLTVEGFHRAPSRPPAVRPAKRLPEPPTDHVPGSATDLAELARRLAEKAADQAAHLKDRPPPPARL
jgi:hypothetical protein